MWRGVCRGVCGGVCVGVCVEGVCVEGVGRAMARRHQSVGQAT